MLLNRKDQKIFCGLLNKEFNKSENDSLAGIFHQQPIYEYFWGTLPGGRGVIQTDKMIDFAFVLVLLQKSFPSILFLTCSKQKTWEEIQQLYMLPMPKGGVVVWFFDEENKAFFNYVLQELRDKKKTLPATKNQLMVTWLYYGANQEFNEKYFNQEDKEMYDFLECRLEPAIDNDPLGGCSFGCRREEIQKLYLEYIASTYDPETWRPYGSFAEKWLPSISTLIKKEFCGQDSWHRVKVELFPKTLDKVRVELAQKLEQDESLQEDQEEESQSDESHIDLPKKTRIGNWVLEVREKIQEDQKQESDEDQKQKGSGSAKRQKGKRKLNNSSANKNKKKSSAKSKSVSPISMFFPRKKSTITQKESNKKEVHRYEDKKEKKEREKEQKEKDNKKQTTKRSQQEQKDKVSYTNQEQKDKTSHTNQEKDKASHTNQEKDKASHTNQEQNEEDSGNGSEKNGKNEKKNEKLISTDNLFNFSQRRSKRKQLVTTESKGNENNLLFQKKKICFDETKLKEGQNGSQTQAKEDKELKAEKHQNPEIQKEKEKKQEQTEKEKKQEKEKQQEDRQQKQIEKEQNEEEQIKSEKKEKTNLPAPNIQAESTRGVFQNKNEKAETCFGSDFESPIEEFHAKYPTVKFIPQKGKNISTYQNPMPGGKAFLGILEGIVAESIQAGAIEINSPLLYNLELSQDSGLSLYRPSSNERENPVLIRQWPNPFAVMVLNQIQELVASREREANSREVAAREAAAFREREEFLREEQRAARILYEKEQEFSRRREEQLQEELKIARLREQELQNREVESRKREEHREFESRKREQQHQELTKCLTEQLNFERERQISKKVNLRKRKLSLEHKINLKTINQHKNRSVMAENETKQSNEEKFLEGESFLFPGIQESKNDLNDQKQENKDQKLEESKADLRRPQGWREEHDESLASDLLLEKKKVTVWDGANRSIIEIVLKNGKKKTRTFSKKRYKEGSIELANYYSNQLLNQMAK